MNISFRAIGRDADITRGPCELKLRSHGPEDEEFIRALQEGLTVGAGDAAADVLIDRMRPVFEAKGWTAP